MTADEYFAAAPAARACAPGRVNLLGEHTDYNDGFVLPTAIPQQTCVAMAASPDVDCHGYSANLDEHVTFSLEGPAPTGFARYLNGCMRMLAARGAAVPPVKIHVDSRVPMGAGLSSSAALEVATLRALRQFLGLSLDDVEIARLAQGAEIRYAGVNCGIMDQMASSLADSGHMLFLDTRTLERKQLLLPAGTAVIVIDSGVARTLAASKYNERRGECEEAARRLGVAALRDVDDLAAVEGLPSPYRERARHVVTENRRVLEASLGVTAARFGELMNASQASLADDYDVSIDALNELAAQLQRHPDIFGARLTGAGFGGACVALGRAGRAATAARDVLAHYNKTGREGRVLVPQLDP